MEITILRDIVVILALSIFIILIFHRLRLPAIVAFLLTGIIVGPHGLALVSAVHEVEIMAEIGVVLLLFTIGIEFSFKKLMQIKKAVIVGGSLQVMLTILVSAGVLSLFNFPLNQAVFFGFLVSLSSTAIVLKMLQERTEIKSPHGQGSLAILIFQDVIIVPMILLTPILAGATGNLAYSLLMMVIKVAGVILFMVVLAKWVVHNTLFQVARTQSRELFLLSILVICMAVAWLTSSIGLSLAMGAFLAGLIISESEYSSYAFGQILPFRDLFTSFFFISIGMLLDINVLIASPVLVLSIVFCMMALKSLIAGFVGTVIGLSFRAALLVGFGLAQIGEFSFILSRFGLVEGLIAAENYQLFLAASVLSMAATPLIIAAAPRMADAIFKLPLPERIKLGSKDLQKPPQVGVMQDHLIIVGFGLNGRNVARAAKTADIPYVILEMNPTTVRRERLQGEPIIYGDATNDESLHQVNIEDAKVIVIAIPDAAATERIVESARRLNAGFRIIVRTRFIHEVERLYALGADDVIPEEFETSVEIFTRVLNRFDIAEDDIERFTADIRANCYRVLRRSHEDNSLPD